ncbi:DUF4189 domain-containing protein [Aggregatibacter kilianii]|uniref:DUF4189 domain-containing protein n=1 Tax=Aggregatibacter kilianii TaxID=2025884 RepID=UPI001EF913A1|nr:DUF4189 domain-containing protein [Aggregatibacter kilianii]
MFLSNKLKLVFSLIFTLFLTACSTMYNPLDTIYWNGREDTEFFARKRLPDESYRCIKDNELKFIHAYRLALYDLKTYEVGRNSTTIFLRTDKVYTGGVTWTYVFTDANHKITSIRDATGFGDIEKEFGCGEYQEAVTIASPADLKKRKMKPRLWAAIVRTPEQNQMLWASDAAYKNVRDAENDALKQCKEYGGQNCQLMMAISNMCLGLATGKNSNGMFDSFGTSIIPDHSKLMAVENCRKRGGSSCEATPVPALCAIPCDMLSDNKCFFDQPQVIIPKLKGGKPVAVALDGSDPIAR